MLLKENYSSDFLHEKFKEYYSTYDDIFNDHVIGKLKPIVTNGLYYNEVDSVINQMYHEYDLINEKLDIYYNFKNILNEIYSNLNKKKIVEIGAGQIPQLSREIAKTSDEQVIAVDEIISRNNNKYDNLLIVRGPFNEESTISNKDLLVGLHPCGATMDIVKQSAINNIDFAIAVCDCIYNPRSFYSTIYGWTEFMTKVNEIVSKSNLGEVHELKLGLSPVIYTNRDRK